MNGKVWLVAGREYREHVAKRSFWIGLLLGPLFFAFIFAIQIFAFKIRPETSKSVAIVDRSGLVAEATAEALRKETYDSGKAQFSVEVVPASGDTNAVFADLNRRIAEKKLFGYLTVGPDLETPGAFRFLTRNVGDARSIDEVEGALRRAVIGARLQARSLALSTEQLEDITKSVRLQTLKVDDEGKTSQRDFGMVWIFTFVYLMIFFVPIIGYGVTALRSILEEKSSRIIEVLLSSVTPFELFMGKIIGLVLVGLTQVGAYAVTGMGLSVYSAAAAPVGMLANVASFFTPVMMLQFLIYFLLGFVLFLTLFAAVGSMVNTEQEAQSMQQPIMWLLIIPFYATFFFISNPDSTAARIISLIPIFTPMIMIMRISVLQPPLWEIALSIVLTTLAIIGIVWLAARIFRVGILMYGKRPTLPEIVKWVKTG
jgi:ABC-2 type transport system permease protein